jgi:hypothetical protein
VIDACATPQAPSNTPAKKENFEKFFWILQNLKEASSSRSITISLLVTREYGRLNNNSYKFNDNKFVALSQLP